MKQRKSVLVTGGAGFLGSNLTRALLSTGAQVDCVDNLITGRLSAVRPLMSNPLFRFVLADITDPGFIDHLPDTRYDEIYHFACPTGVPNIQIYGEEMLRTCSIGTEVMLRLARDRTARLVYASSAEVYGDPAVFPQGEAYCGNVDPIGSRSAYEEGKRFAEALVRQYVVKEGVDARIVRIFNTFGVGMQLDDQRVIPQFIRHIKQGRNVVVYGDGTQTRTHLYVDDLLAGVAAVLHSGCRGEAYNIGGEQQFSILELVAILRELTPLPVNVEFKPHFIEDHGGRLPLTAKVRQLGWQPRVDLVEGLRRTMEGFGVPVRVPMTHGATREAALQR